MPNTILLYDWCLNVLTILEKAAILALYRMFRLQLRSSRQHPIALFSYTNNTSVLTPPGEQGKREFG